MFYLCQSSWDQFSWNPSTLLAVLHAQTMLGRISSLFLIYSADGELLSIFLQSFEGVFLDDRVSFHLSSFLSPALLWGVWFLPYECEPWVCIHLGLLSKPEEKRPQHRNVWWPSEIWRGCSLKAFIPQKTFRGSCSHWCRKWDSEKSGRLPEITQLHGGGAEKRHQVICSGSEVSSV